MSFQKNKWTVSTNSKPNWAKHQTTVMRCAGRDFRRSLDNSLAVSQLVDWSTRGLVNSLTATFL